MTAITQTPITLQPSHRLALCAGLHRATAYGLWAEAMAGVGTMWQMWAVESYTARTDPDHKRYHTVIIDQTRPDATAVRCTCSAALAGRVCMHVALALVEAEALPYPLEGYICPHCQRVFDTAHDATVHTLVEHQSASVRQLQPIDPEVARRVLNPLLATGEQRQRAVP
jgi:hypothetical protein